MYNGSSALSIAMVVNSKSRVRCAGSIYDEESFVSIEKSSFYEVLDLPNLHFSNPCFKDENGDIVITKSFLSNASVYCETDYPQLVRDIHVECWANFIRTVNSTNASNIVYFTVQMVDGIDTFCSCSVFDNNNCEVKTFAMLKKDITQSQHDTEEVKITVGLIIITAVLLSVILVAGLTLWIRHYFKNKDNTLRQQPTGGDRESAVYNTAIGSGIDNVERNPERQCVQNGESSSRCSTITNVTFDSGDESDSITHVKQLQNEVGEPNLRQNELRQSFVSQTHTQQHASEETKEKHINVCANGLQQDEIAKDSFYIGTSASDVHEKKPPLPPKRKSQDNITRPIIQSTKPPFLPPRQPPKIPPRVMTCDHAENNKTSKNSHSTTCQNVYIEKTECYSAKEFNRMPKALPDPEQTERKEVINSEQVMKSCEVHHSITQENMGTKGHEASIEANYDSGIYTKTKKKRCAASLNDYRKNPDAINTDTLQHEIRNPDAYGIDLKDQENNSEYSPFTTISDLKEPISLPVAKKHMIAFTPSYITPTEPVEMSAQIMSVSETMSHNSVTSLCTYDENDRNTYCGGDKKENICHKPFPFKDGVNCSSEFLMLKEKEHAGDEKLEEFIAAKNSSEEVSEEAGHGGTTAVPADDEHYGISTRPTHHPDSGNQPTLSLCATGASEQHETIVLPSTYIHGSPQAAGADVTLTISVSAVHRYFSSPSQLIQLNGHNNNVDSTS